MAPISVAQIDLDHRKAGADLWHGLAKARVGQGKNAEAAEAFTNVIILDYTRQEARVGQIT